MHTSQFQLTSCNSEEGQQMEATVCRLPQREGSFLDSSECSLHAEARYPGSYLLIVVLGGL